MHHLNEWMKNSTIALDHVHRTYRYYANFPGQMDEAMAIQIAMNAMQKGLTPKVIKLSFVWTGLYPYSLDNLLNNVHPSVFKKADKPVPSGHRSKAQIKRQLELALGTAAAALGDEDLDSDAELDDELAPFDEDGMVDGADSDVEGPLPGGADGSDPGSQPAQRVEEEGEEAEEGEGVEEVEEVEEGPAGAGGPGPAPVRQAQQSKHIIVTHRTPEGSEIKVNIPIGNGDLGFKRALGVMLKTLGEFPNGQRLRRKVVDRITAVGLTSLFRDSWIAPRNDAMARTREKAAALTNDDDTSSPAHIPYARLPRGHVYTTDEALALIKEKEEAKAQKEESAALGAERRRQKEQQRIIGRYEKEKTANSKVRYSKRVSRISVTWAF